MKSVLIATDLVRKSDGTLTPLEINTNSSHELTYNRIPPEGSEVVDFLSNFSEIFNHVEFNIFLQTNDITKLKVIDKPGSMGPIFQSFANHYGFEYDFISVNEGSLTIPVVDDSDDTLIIRVSYDAYALIDDLYARDNFEFHNLIKDESFASPVTFNTGDESNIDTITAFEPSVDGVAPNYIVKPRVPGYPKGVYPKLYRLDNIEELNSLKASISENEFVQKYEYDPTSGRIDNRIYFIRSMDLVYGTNLDVINVITYKSVNSISLGNSLLRYDSELIENKRLDPLFASKWHPKFKYFFDNMYHFDATDEILLQDYTTMLANQVEVNTEVLGVNIDDKLKEFGVAPIETLETFQTGVAEVGVIKENQLKTMFINISAIDDNGNEYSWYDGVDNKYLLQKQGTNLLEYISVVSSNIEIGDKTFVFNPQSNTINSLTITDVYFDVKDIPTYIMSLRGDFREFFIKLEDNVYLIQHNAGCDEWCGVFYTCSYSQCFDCGKLDTNCPNCSGQLGYGALCNSDVRLKKNIKLVGTSEMGINIYEFVYLNEESSLYTGVIAQDLLDSEYSDAVSMGEDGFYRVDYSKIDVEFKKIN
jgi:hypothetical protein